MYVRAFASMEMGDIELAQKLSGWNWRWRYPRNCAVWAGTACERLPPANQGLWAEDGCGLLSAGRDAALSWDVAGGGTGDHFRDRHAGAVRPGHQRPPGDARPAVAAGEDVLGAAAGVHHVRQLQEDRAGDGYRGGPGRGAGMAERLREAFGTRM